MRQNLDKHIIHECLVKKWGAPKSIDLSSISIKHNLCWVYNDYMVYVYIYIYIYRNPKDRNAKFQDVISIDTCVSHISQVSAFQKIGGC